MMVYPLRLPALLLLFLTSFIAGAQRPDATPAAIEKLIEDGRAELAHDLLATQLAYFYDRKNADTLPAYMPGVGQLAIKRSGVDGAIKEVQAFAQKIQSLAPGIRTLRRTAIEAADFYGNHDRNELAYNTTKDVLRYSLQLPDQSPSRIAKIESDLGAYADRMGNIDLSISHCRRAIRLHREAPSPDYNGLYLCYNNMGASMWYLSRTDSAAYYFNKALQTLQRLEPDDQNRYYRPAVLYNNLSAIYSAKGKTTEAIGAMKHTISNLRTFLAGKDPHPKKKTALTFQFQAIDNLAGIYKELGDLQQAQSLLEYAYGQKQQHLDANNPELFKSQILLGQLYYAQADLDKAEQLLTSGRQRISQVDGDYLYWQADACYTLALLYDSKKQVVKAARYFEAADSLYAASLNGSYDDIYLEFLRNTALFYAEQGDEKKGLVKANKAYQYILKNQGPNTLTAFYQLLNLSEVCYRSGKYREALSYSDKGLKLVNTLIRSGNKTLLDSIKMELQKPKAILLKTKSGYQLSSKKDAAYLERSLQELAPALDMLERRKSIITDPESAGAILSAHKELLEFVKKINLDLYRLTKDPKYIGSIIGLHESGLYTRIRARLDNNDSLRYAHIPAAVRYRERQLQTALQQALTSNKSATARLRDYFTATEQWQQYREQLRTNYPRYYAMRYAAIFKPLDKIQASIAPDVSVIRFFFVDKELFALVADQQRTAIVPLDTTRLEQQITALSRNGMDVPGTAANLHSLYQQLWAPLATHIHHQKITIIPDGLLFNLNFELLTPTRISAFRELATKSLLARHTCSYHYSLFVLDNTVPPRPLPASFIAFAPGFSDELKAAHLSAKGPAITADAAYLNLLPQPFTVALAARAGRLFGGNALLNERSTVASFKAHAGNHKIIHIGTHAESNNKYPEYSRLVFAKSGQGETDEANSLYLPEIYNCDLSANLAVMTACESGKPGFRDGEGMISLAHAFNYAGSESMLTGLWKIDEQASAMIMESFYKQLLEGQPKDEALRQAKLAYLEKAGSRMLAPHYWAGLVIMGDTAPIQLSPQRRSIPWLIAATILAILSSGLILTRQHSSRRSARKA